MHKNGKTEHCGGRQYGYARVSSREQNEARQLAAMRNAGIRAEYIFADKQSGRDFDRPQYKKLLRRLRRGDTLFVQSIDRLGRNYREIIEQWQYLTSEKGVDIVVLDMPLLDTRRRDEGLTGLFISNLVLQILSYVAQTECENIRRRQAEGIAAAKERGVAFGRHAIEIPPDFRSRAEELARTGMKSADITAEFGVSRSLYYRWLGRTAPQQSEAENSPPLTEPRDMQNGKFREISPSAPKKE